MVNVIILQTDNRPSLDYLLQTQNVNKMFCDMLGYEYLFLELDNNKYGNIHIKTKKILVVNDFLQNTKMDILVFLDSDAWIQNGFYLKDVINNLCKNEKKYGCFSRDPYLTKNTFINSGSFIIKINEYTKKMYNDIILDLHNNTYFNNNWPHDQYYISKYICENKEDFVIFVPDILNTPIGKVLRHNWVKNDKMYEDLNLLISLKSEKQIYNYLSFFNEEYYDIAKFPNEMVHGYEYIE